MDMVPDADSEGFSFIWAVQNIKYYFQKKGEGLYSPCFKLHLSDANEWRLFIYRSENKNGTIGVFLQLFSGPVPVKVNTFISIRFTNGTLKRRKSHFGSSIFKEVGDLGCTFFLNHSDFFKKGDDAILENDTLTLRYRILKDSPEPPVSGQCYARTVIDVKRIAFLWNLENFKELLQKGKKNINFHTASSKNQSFTVDIFLSGEFYNGKNIQVQIKQNSPYQKVFVTFKLSLLDVDGKTDQSVCDEHWFGSSEETQNWHFTFLPVEKILDHEKLYLLNDKLSLRCEFVVSYGEKYNEVERTEYCELEELDKECSNNASFTGSLKDNLQSFHKEAKFSDLTIRTASSKEFPVHKAILCARSEVFSAMFEHDTKEKQTGVVEIQDLNDDTVSKLLLFTYTDILEDLEWEVASELYFAADKYGIVALKKECSTFLKGNLNISNVCDALVLADMYQDQDMKSATQDFVLDHANEIVNSEYWTTFIQEKPNLAAETLQVLFMRKL